MRMFTGVRIPDALAPGILEIGRKLKMKAGSPRLVAPENLHFTLKFLGETEVDKLPLICDLLSSVASRAEPFALTIKGLGGFPDIKSMRVFWAGGFSGGRLKRLNADIEEVLEDAGFPREKRLFAEHVTIARFKAPPDVGGVEKVIKKYGAGELGIFLVDNFELIESRMTASGPFYKTFRKFFLGGENGQGQST